MQAQCSSRGGLCIVHALFGFIQTRKSSQLGYLGAGTGSSLFLLVSGLFRGEADHLYSLDLSDTSVWSVEVSSGFFASSSASLPCDGNSLSVVTQL